MKRVFIVGQGGSGKSTLVKYFMQHPIKDWEILDFDNGKFDKPNDKDKELMSQWVSKQREFWLKEVNSDKYKNKNVLLFGVGLFPWQVGGDKDTYFGYLSCDQEERKERLGKRNDIHLWKTYRKNAKDLDKIVNKLEKLGAHKFDTSLNSVEETAQEIKEWLNTI